MYGMLTAQKRWSTPCYTSLVLTCNKGAPECYRFNEYYMNTSIPTGQGTDIWSFGCVLSEAVVWMAEGPGGLDEYRKARENHFSRSTSPNSKLLGACFHDGTKVIDTVLVWHERAKKSLQDSSHVTGKIEDIIRQGCLLEHSSLRKNGQQLDIQFDMALGGAAPAPIKIANMALSSLEADPRFRGILPIPQMLLVAPENDPENTDPSNQGNISGNHLSPYSTLNEQKQQLSLVSRS
jgi:hypothetical protein